jgi:hypothetical protein
MGWKVTSLGSLNHRKLVLLRTVTYSSPGGNLHTLHGQFSSPDLFDGLPTRFINCSGTVRKISFTNLGGGGALTL